MFVKFLGYNLLCFPLPFEPWPWLSSRKTKIHEITHRKKKTSEWLYLHEDALFPRRFPDHFLQLASQPPAPRPSQPPSPRPSQLPWGTPPRWRGYHQVKVPPAMLLFRPDKSTKIRFPGIKEGLIPITPSESTFKVKDPYIQKEYRIRRRQYALTGEYTFTDYKSQGQTMEYVIIDIGKPPTGALSPFGVYVALSRSRGRKNIRLLRDFDRQLFQHHPSENLRLDMIRMKDLNEATKKQWKEQRRV